MQTAAPFTQTPAVGPIRKRFRLRAFIEMVQRFAQQAENLSAKFMRETRDLRTCYPSKHPFYASCINEA